MRKFQVLIVIALAVLSTSASADPQEAMREKVRERIRAVRTAKIIQFLDLDEATAARLFPILNRHDDALVEIVKENGSIRRDMKRMIEGGPIDEAKLSKLIDRFLENRAKIQKLDEERIRDARKVLRSVQAAKLVVLLPEIDHKIQRAMHRALRKRLGPENQSPRLGKEPLDDDLDF
ncbi:MAG: hypothetical protein HY698_12645 [Deltaproteobacteria bacterium]|nr:hypothetical protein [Deltaproteobacteria bacterium]